MAKISVITSFLGELRDRFCLYNQQRSIVEKLEAAAAIKGMDGVEVVYPYDFQDAGLVAETLRRLGLGVAAVNVNIKGEREFAAGSLTAQDPGVRRRAVDIIKGGLDAAARLGCGRISVCPLSDGHEYAFQHDYQDSWRRMRDCLGEAAAHRPEITLSMEYKPSETRVFSTLAGVSNAVLMIKEIGLPNLGVTVDVGHSLYGGESPAQSLALLYHHGVKPYIHVNDNYRNWDWDLMAGTVNFWDLLEFIWTAVANGYEDWWTFDVFPARMDPEACFTSSVRMLKAMFAMAGRIDPQELQHLRQADPRERAMPRIMEYIWQAAGIDLRGEGR